MKFTLVFLIVLISVFAGHHEKHKCIHDKISEKNIQNGIVDITPSEDEERHL